MRVEFPWFFKNSFFMRVQNASFRRFSIVADDNSASLYPRPVADEVPENERSLSTFVPFGGPDFPIAIFCGPPRRGKFVPRLGNKNDMGDFPIEAVGRAETVFGLQLLNQGDSAKSRTSTPFGLEKTNSSGPGDRLSAIFEKSMVVRLPNKSTIDVDETNPFSDSATTKSRS